MQSMFRRAPTALLLVAGLVACGSGPHDTDTEDPGVPTDAVKFGPEHNYSYSGEITISAVEVQAGADSVIDWCALTTDLRGRAVTDPSAVDQVLLAAFDLSQAELMEKVETNALKQSDSSYQGLVVSPEACSVKMSEFEIIGNIFDPAEWMVEEAGTTWLASVLNLPDGRYDILTSTFVVPKEASTHTAVDITDDSASLSFEADLHSAEPLRIAAGDAPWIDWSAITTDVNGAPFDTLLGDRLLLGKVPVDTVEEAEALFLRLDQEAEKLYFLDVYAQTAADLSTAKARDGSVFQGFTPDGVWFVGVECMQCTSPAPLILSVVEVTE